MILNSVDEHDNRYNFKNVFFAGVGLDVCK